LERFKQSNGLCPNRDWCFPKRIRVSKHAIPDHHCAFEEHSQLYQCPAYRTDGHEHILDRGDIMAVCAGAPYCGDGECYHASPHRWNPMQGCHAVHCRQLEGVLRGWDEEERGEKPVDVMVACEQIEEE
jgi:hypothetical protein